jgi:hypothetical protein
MNDREFEMGATLDDLTKQFVATVEQNWDASNRPRRNMIELALAHTLQVVGNAAESDVERLKARGLALVSSLRNARSLAEIKEAVKQDCSRELGFQTWLVANLETGKLVETAESYVSSSVGDLKTVGQTYLDSAFNELRGNVPADFADALLTEAAGCPLLSKERAIDYLSTEIAHEINSPIVDRDVVSLALSGDGDAARKIKGALTKYAKDKVAGEIAHAAGIQPQTLAQAIDAYRYGSESLAKWDSVSTSEKMQMVVNTARLINKLTGDNKDVGEAIAFADKGSAVCAAAIAFSVASGWGAVFAGMQLAGALGAMSGGGTNQGDSTVVSLIQRVMEYLQVQFSHLNARLDAIERTLQQIQIALEEIKFSVALVDAHLLAVQHDIQLLQEQVTNVGRLVAARYARAEEAKCITLLDAAPATFSDSLFSCLAVHAQKVLNASDPLQTLQVSALESEEMYDQLHHFSRSDIWDRDALVPWASLKGVLEEFEATQGRASPLRKPVDFNEVILGTRNFTSLLRFLRDSGWWTGKEDFAKAMAGALRVSDEMALQFQAAKGAEAYMAAPGPQDLLARLDAGNVRGGEALREVLAARIERSPRPVVHSTDDVNHKCLQERLLDAIKAQVARVVSAWDKLELSCACEVVLDGRDTTPEGLAQFARRWAPLELKNVALDCADQRGWPESDAKPTLTHSVGTTVQWSAPGLEPLQQRLWIFSRRNSPRDAAGSADWYHFDLDVFLRFGSLARKLQHLRDEEKEGKKHVGDGFTQIVGLPEAPLTASFGYVPPDQPISTPNRRSFDKGAIATGVGRRLYEDFTTAIPPQTFWHLARYFVQDPLVPNPRVESYTGQLNIQEHWGAAVATASEHASVAEAIRALSGFSLVESPLKTLAFNMLAEQLAWMSKPAVMGPLLERTIDKRYEANGGASERLRETVRALVHELETLDRRVDTLICVCAAVMPASLASNTHLKGLLQPLAVPAPGQSSVEAVDHYLRQAVFPGKAQLVRDGTLEELGARLRARRAAIPSFSFRELMEEGFAYFEKSMFNLWLDALDRGKNLQIELALSDLERLKGQVEVALKLRSALAGFRDVVKVSFELDAVAKVAYGSQAFRVDIAGNRIRFTGTSPSLFALVSLDDAEEQHAVIRRWINRIGSRGLPGRHA